MAKFIEADVIQKIATEAEWLTQTRIPYKGQIMLVGDSSGKVTNIKVGDGVNPFADLNYMFDSIQQNVGYIAIESNSLPTPLDDVAWGMVTEGTYTFGGSDVFTVPAGHWGIANYSSGAWSLVDMGEMPIQQGVTVINPTGSGLPTEKATADYAPSKEDVGIKFLAKGVNVISDLATSDPNDETLWGEGFLNAAGGVDTSSSNDWKYTKKFYPLLKGSYDAHMTLSGNARLLYYDKDFNLIGNFQQTVSPTPYNFILNADLDETRYFRFSHNFSAEPDPSLLKLEARDSYSLVTGDVFELAGTIKDSDRYVIFQNDTKINIGGSLLPADFVSSDFSKYLSQGYVSNSGEITSTVWDNTTGSGWSNNMKAPFPLPQGGVFNVESTMSGNAYCAILDEKQRIIQLISASSTGVVVDGDVAKFQIDLRNVSSNRYLVMSFKDYNPDTNLSQHTEWLGKVKVTAADTIFYKKLAPVILPILNKEIKHTLANNSNIDFEIEAFDFAGNPTTIGGSNKIYKVPVPVNNGELRIKFDVKFDEDINILGSDTAKVFGILKWYNRSFRTRVVPKNTTVATDSWGSGYGNTNTQCIRSNSQFDLHFSGGSFTAQTFTPSRKNMFGDFLFGIRYNEDVESTPSNRDVCLSITPTLFRIYKKTTDTTLYSKVIDSELLLSDIVDELRELEFLDVHVNGVRNYKAIELIKIAEINLSSTSRWVNGTEYWDSGICWIAKAVSDKWNTIEIIFTEGKIFYAFNGETFEITSTISFLNPDTIMYFGGELGASNNLQNTIRNIHINQNYLGDAEVVNYSLNYPLQTPKVYAPKVVSDYNPLIYMFVGHQVQHTTEDNVTYVDGTECSSERLDILFKHLASKGYVSVSPIDVANWKQGLQQLPKRCFVPIFDDYRFEIYANPLIKQIFDQNNVKGSLALITERVYNGYPNQPNYGGYTYDQYNFFQRMNADGWNVHSHTRDHNGATGYLRFRKTSEMYNELNSDVCSAIKANTSTVCLTYPQGQTRTTAMYALMNTSFKIALLTANGNNLPCSNNNDYYMYRVELGQRNPIDNLLDSIV